MSRTIATSYESLNTIAYRTRSSILASDWQKMARQQNLIWARFISEWSGHVFNPPFDAAGSVSPVNQGAGRDLTDLSLGGIVTRPLDSGKFRVGVAFYGNVVLQYDLVNESTGTEVVTDASINSGLAAADKWRVGTHDLTATEVGDGSGGTGYISVSIDGAREADANGDDIFQIRAGEIEIVTPSEIPAS